MRKGARALVLRVRRVRRARMPRRTSRLRIRWRRRWDWMKKFRYRVAWMVKKVVRMRPRSRWYGFSSSWLIRVEYWIGLQGVLVERR